jgi:hypothetical protein
MSPFIFMSEDTLNYWIYSEVIMPEVIDVRNRILNQSEQTEYAEKFGQICIIQDGAYGQIQAIENKLIPWCKRHDYGITFAKYAAGCSLTQSPNDKGSMHSNLHRLFKKDFFRSDIAEPETGSWYEL